MNVYETYPSVRIISWWSNEWLPLGEPLNQKTRMADCGGGGANCWRLCISFSGGYSDQLLDFDIRSNLDSAVDEKFKRLQCSSQKLNHKSNQAQCETVSRLLVRLRGVQDRDFKSYLKIILL